MTIGELGREKIDLIRLLNIWRQCSQRHKVHISPDDTPKFKVQKKYDEDFFTLK